MRPKQTKAELIAEVGALRERVAELEQQPLAHKRSNHLLRTFIDVLPHCGFSFDADGTVLEVLAGKNSPLHDDAPKLKGQALHDFLPQVDAEVLLAAIRGTIETGRKKSFEFEFSVLAGRRWFLAKTIAPKNGSTGRPTITCILEDITSKKVAENALKELQGELEQQTVAKQESEKRFP